MHLAKLPQNTVGHPHEDRRSRIRRNCLLPSHESCEVRRQRTSPVQASKIVMTTAKKSANSNHCWPGFEPTPGKKAGSKGSCEKVPGTHSKATKHATQKVAAASKVQKQK